MSNEIEIGEYGRTNTGKIFIFAWLVNENGVTYENKVILIEDGRLTKNFYYFDKDEKIVKHSKNIIDLIEEGDYVNGKKVRMNYETGKFRNIPRQIKSIVTKEQFANMEYKVGV